MTWVRGQGEATGFCAGANVEIDIKKPGAISELKCEQTLHREHKNANDLSVEQIEILGFPFPVGHLEFEMLAFGFWRHFIFLIKSKNIKTSLCDQNYY